MTLDFTPGFRNSNEIKLPPKCFELNTVQNAIKQFKLVKFDTYIFTKKQARPKLFTVDYEFSESMIIYISSFGFLKLRLKLRSTRF